LAAWALDFEHTPYAFPFVLLTWFSIGDSAALLPFGSDLYMLLATYAFVVAFRLDITLWATSAFVVAFSAPAPLGGLSPRTST